MTATPAMAEGAVLIVLLLACVTDLRARRIPNAFPAALLILFGLAVLSSPGLRAEMASHLASGGVAFVVGFILFTLGAFGGGDVKLFAALALFVPLESLSALTVLTAYAGGVIGAAFLLRRWMSRRRDNREDHQHRGKVPYAVAILCGWIATYWS